MIAPETAARQPPPWHACPAAEALGALEADPSGGLRDAEAARRLARHGANRLPGGRRRPAWRRLLDQFSNGLVLVLLFGAALALAIGHLGDALVIVLVISVNAALGLHQERRAERTLEALEAMLERTARVLRDGVVRQVPADALVPGDVVLLDAGDQVPADGRVLEAHDLEVDESALTGESQAVEKSATEVAAEAPLAERACMLFMNTALTRGRASMLVTDTGAGTEIGRIAGLIASTERPPTPLQRELAVLGRRLATLAVVLVAFIFALDLARGVDWSEAAMTAVALAVAAIPEGLPAVVTVTLALGMGRMARHRAVVKHLSAVETLGATAVICTDKTGTLTENRMRARAVWTDRGRQSVDATGGGDVLPGPALRTLVLCTEARVGREGIQGEPTECALLELGQRLGCDVERAQAEPRLAEIPFDSGHKFMATFHAGDGAAQMLVKGAPDVVLERCTAIWTARGTRPLDAAGRRRVDAAMADMADDALRVLALAWRPVERLPEGDDEAWAFATDWTLLALVGLMDPPRPEAAQAIARCQGAGIAVKMITGDHLLTARAVARELGLGGDALAGSDLDRLDDRALAAAIGDTAVFARVSPEHKLRLVRVLQARGCVTAMTGDGVNDAPALEAADIGVAMGGAGTEVARQAADMVLTDDNFATIVRAVREGRTVYENLVKFVRFQLSTNVGAMLCVLLATLLGMPAPFSAAQLLWVNIIMDGPPALTLGVEPPRAGAMGEPPRRRHEHVLGAHRFALLTLHGTLMALGTLWVFAGALDDAAHAGTLAFTTFVLFQVFNVFNARAERSSTFAAGFFSNSRLWLALALVLVLQVVVVHWGPAQQLFDTVALGGADWLLAALVASSVLVVEELRKLAVAVLARR